MLRNTILEPSKIGALSSSSSIRTENVRVIATAQNFYGQIPVGKVCPTQSTDPPNF